MEASSCISTIIGGLTAPPACHTTSTPRPAPSQAARHLASRSSFSQRLIARAPMSRSSRLQQLVIVNVGWDPEGVLAAPQGGHIARRAISMNKQLEAQVEKEADRRYAEQEQERIQRREGRRVPGSDADLIAYFMETVEEDLEFEVSRHRPRLTEDFFKTLDKEIGTLRFSSPPNEEKVKVYEGLRDVLKDGVVVLDAMAVTISNAKERLQQILTAQDKKAALLELASENKIDEPLLSLIQQNALSARAAGQFQAADFLDKLHVAALKFGKK